MEASFSANGTYREFLSCLPSIFEFRSENNIILSFVFLFSIFRAWFPSLWFPSLWFPSLWLSPLWLSEGLEFSSVSLPFTVIPSRHCGRCSRSLLGLVAEAGPEAIIPLSVGMRSRALALYEETGRRLGVRPYAEGGLVGTMTEGWREKIPVSFTPSLSLAMPGPATINLNFDLTGLVRQVVIESREDIDGAVDRIADAIANNLRAVFQNMTK
jgi:hypothetical protein